MPTTAAPTHTNRLVHASSPYLLQHARNPVDWFEWGAAALDQARREDKPIFLSIGYSACHWCHVMAHESFEDAAIAAELNKNFVNIKVDREERPDLDEIYMQATLIMNQGQGGWPMSVWLTPDLKPFFAGTYFPPRAKWGRPGLVEISERIAQAWRDNRAALLASADRLAHVLVESLAAGGEPAALSLGTIDQTVGAVSDAFDPERGGILGGGRNKFPPSLALDLFHRTAQRLGSENADARRLRQLVEVTLEHMARGGIYDHLAGGIARYSTDPDWHVPHFEKMLYDQALVSRAYVDAYMVTKKPLFRRIAAEIFDYVISDLQSPDGGFYSARDADSDGVEGKYYVWTKEEIVCALGADEAELFCSYYDVSEAGNWPDPHAPGEAKNVLHATRGIEAVAKLNRIASDELERRLSRAREKLLAVRRTRTPPGRDEKILVEWNGLMIASLARGGAALGESRFVAAAERAADFLLRQQYRAGRLLRSYHEGRALESAFLTDYACLIEGLLDLYEATGQTGRLDQAVALNHVVNEHYYDHAAGGYFLTADDHEQLIVRSKPHQDGVTPSGNATQIMNLLRLSVMLDDESLRAMAEQSLRCFAADIAQMPGSGERFLAAAEFALLGPIELAVIGPFADPATRALLSEIHGRYLPNRVLMFADPAGGPAPASPLLKDRSMVAGRPTVYVCRDHVCQAPVTTPQALADVLDGSA